MDFDAWLQTGFANGQLTRDSSNRIWIKGRGLPLSTNDLQQMYKSSPNGFDPKGGPASAPQQAPAADPFRDQQLAMLPGLQDRASGKGGPTVADLQLQKATDANMGQAFGFGAAQQAQGLGSAAALRGIGDARSNIQQESAGQSAILRNQEQVQGQQELQALLHGARGEDIQNMEVSGNLALGNRQLDFQRQQAQQMMLMRLLGGFGQMATGMGTMGGGGGASEAGNWGSNPNEWSQYPGSYSAPPMPSAGASGYEPGTPSWAKDDSGLAASSGGEVPGYASGGDSPQNDTVRALLSPGEIVLPRSVVNSDDPATRAAAFVEAILSGKARRAA